MIAAFASILLTRKIEHEFDRFLGSAKEVSAIRCDDISMDDIVEDSGGHELERAEADMKLFLTKVERVIRKAQNALNESQNALTQIEGAAKIMEYHTSEMSIDEQNRKEISKYIDKSEDLTINSLEEIANTKKMLDKFQSTIDNIVKKMS